MLPIRVPQQILEQVEAIACSLLPEDAGEEKEAAGDGGGGEERSSPSRELRIEVLERCTKGTALGCLLPAFLVVMSSHTVRTLDSALDLLQELSPLSRLTAKVSLDGVGRPYSFVGGWWSSRGCHSYWP